MKTAKQWIEIGNNGSLKTLALPEDCGIIGTSQEEHSMEDINRKKALTAALSQIEKQFGKAKTPHETLAYEPVDYAREVDPRYVQATRKS